MNWELAISRHLAALRNVLAGLTAMAARAGSLRDLREMRERSSRLPPANGSPGDPAPEEAEEAPAAQPPLLTRHRRRAILLLLRPAEAAARRLVIVAALKGGLAEARAFAPDRPAAKPPSRRAHVAMPIVATSAFLRVPGGTGILMPLGHPTRQAPAPSLRRIALPLADPPRRLSVRRVAEADAPRISFPGWSERTPLPVRHPAAPDDLVDATRILLRLEALAAALGDLPRAARRFLRQQALREAARQRARQPMGRSAAPGTPALSSARYIRLSPLRSGRPPGALRRPWHEVHDLVGDLHGLAYQAIEHPDTS